MLFCSVVMAGEKLEPVPSVIDNLGDHLAQRLSTQADTLNELRDQNKWTDAEWKDLLYANQMAANKIESAFFELGLCKSKKQGYYCEQSLRDLKEAEYELEKLDKEIIKAGTISL